MENKYSPALKELSSRQNHFVQFTRTLKSKKNRDIERSTIVEGRFMMQELIDSSLIIRLFFLSQSEYEKDSNQLLIQRIVQRSGRSFLVSDNLMEYMSLTENSSGFLAVIETTAPGIDDMEMEHDGLYIILDSIQDPGNLGTIIRTAYACTAGGIILYGDCSDPYNPKTIRASAGMVFKLPCYSVPQGEARTLAALKNRGIAFLATSSGGSRSFLEHALPPPCAVILGNEAHGVSPELSALSDESLTIPMGPGIDSLNVSVAAALFCYRFYELHRLQGIGGK